MTRLQMVLVCGMLWWAELTIAAPEQFFIPYFLSASNPTQQSFVRVVWPSCPADRDYHVSIVAVDDAGESFGPVEFSGDWCDRVVAFNSDDLEYGNLSKGIAVGTGQGVGDWQLYLTIGEYGTTGRVDVQSYVRTSGGFLTAMHDTVPFIRREDYEDINHHYWVATFNPARNTAQQSRLRLVNPNTFPVAVWIRGRHDRTYSLCGGQRILVPERGAVAVTAQELETHNPDWEAPGGYDGQLGKSDEQCNTPTGKWRLTIRATREDARRPHDGQERVIVMNLMETPQGHLTNLSTAAHVAPRSEMPPTEPSPPPSSGTFDFEFEFVGHVPQPVRDSFRDAAERWERVIIQDFPDISASIPSGACLNDSTVQREVDDLLVFVKIGNLNSGAAARAAPCRLESDSTVESRPYAAWVHVNGEPTDEYWENRRHDLFDAIIRHELGHALGFYPEVFEASGYLRHNPNTHFAGPKAREAFRQYGRSEYSGEAVPMEPDGAHWHVGAFANSGPQIYPELMAPQISKRSVLSRVTIQAFADLGYEVDANKADEWRGHVPGVSASSKVIDLSQDVR